MLCISFEIWREILNFSGQVRGQSKRKYLLYNQRKSTFLLTKFSTFVVVVITLLCISFKIWRQILNFSDQASGQSKSKYLLYNQRKSTFILTKVFNICCCCHNLTYLITRLVSQRNTTCKHLTLQLSHYHSKIGI